MGKHFCPTVLIIPRILLWGIPAIWFVRNGFLDIYIWFPLIIYSLGIIAASQEAEPQTSSSTQLDASALEQREIKHARTGLNNLLDVIMVTADSLAPETEIITPSTKDLLAYPTKTRCITLRDGAAIVSVKLPYVGEIDSEKFKTRFNDRLTELLDIGKLPSKPPKVFIDKDTNIAYPSHSGHWLHGLSRLYYSGHSQSHPCRYFFAELSGI